MRARFCFASILLAALGCAVTQPVSLDVEPTGAQVYVDGRLWTGAQERLALRSDRDHTLYFKRAGYRPELVVLRSEAGERGWVLVPARVTVRLLPETPARSELRIEREIRPEDSEKQHSESTVND